MVHGEQTSLQQHHWGSKHGSGFGRVTLGAEHQHELEDL